VPLSYSAIASSDDLRVTTMTLGHLLPDSSDPMRRGVPLSHALCRISDRIEESARQTFDRWDGTMADIVAHLMSAHHLVDQLYAIGLHGVTSVPIFDAVSVALCDTLTKLDECSAAVREPRDLMRTSSAPNETPAESWRDLIAIGRS
jgi:hypothetical protein